jgi:putative FmdB family regulatory protein
MQPVCFSCEALSYGAMPTYEFRCESGHTTDRFFRSIGAAPAVIECPECGTSAVRQVSGGIGLVFKGSGFYITDYGKDGKKPRDSAKPAESGGGSEAKSEKSGASGGESGSSKSGVSGGESGSSKSGASGGESGSSGAAAKPEKPASGSSGSSGSDK